MLLTLNEIGKKKINLSPSLSLSLSHTHTHTHTHRLSLTLSIHFSMCVWYILLFMSFNLQRCSTNDSFSIFSPLVAFFLLLGHQVHLPLSFARRPLFFSLSPTHSLSLSLSISSQTWQQKKVTRRSTKNLRLRRFFASEQKISNHFLLPRKQVHIVAPTSTTTTKRLACEDFFMNLLRQLGKLISSTKAKKLSWYVMIHPI